LRCRGPPCCRCFLGVRGVYHFLLEAGEGEKQPSDAALLSRALRSPAHPRSRLPPRRAATRPLGNLFARLREIDRLPCSFRLSDIFCQACTESAWAQERVLSCSVHIFKEIEVLRRHTCFPVCWPLRFGGFSE